MGRPVAVTQGDPAGIGPEITHAAWRALKDGGPVFFVIGDPSLYGGTAREIKAAAEASRVFADALPVLSSPLAVPAVPGRPDARNAPSTISSIERAVGLTVAGDACGVVTNPIAKSVLREAGFGHPGHTEFVADLTADLPVDSARGPVMMLAGPSLRVALVSIHKPLRDAIASLTADRIAHVVRVTFEALKRDFGIDAPRLALAGLNPHAGEGGHIGREEIEIITPAADALRADGFDIAGPLPPDAMFHAEARAGYDAAICLYHDQGLIPLKALDFWNGVNVTLGLPIVRTSPDHGTAFDIAGTGVARADSLIAAIRLAAEMGRRRGV
ncbi:MULTISPECIES: 4-hydroxythreonine-4-phosphate dehydrogenase PdxA [Hyphobacterium]|uniref:4-hydroxythreonine-4-phosphate dehydrogenase n=1 Tax=Hyphobacterium vulgare TaxID=1736751 RepID=A0ABV7A0N2_9PROT